MFCISYHFQSFRSVDAENIPYIFNKEKTETKTKVIFTETFGCFKNLILFHGVKRKIHYLFKWIQLNGNVKIG